MVYEVQMIFEHQAVHSRVQVNVCTKVESCPSRFSSDPAVMTIRWHKKKQETQSSVYKALILHNVNTRQKLATLKDVSLQRCNQKGFKKKKKKPTQQS